MAKKNQDPSLESVLNEPIAIIGVNCQFPGAHLDIEDINSFHEFLIQGQTSIKEVPANRWNMDEYYDPDRKKADKIITRKGGFLNNPHLFDADFFRISPAEAKQMDPQQRLFLEVSIRALNHANIPLQSLAGSDTGVYCGTSTHDYSQLNLKDKVQFNEYTQIGAANSATVGRLCYFLNLKGPSMAVDTACSSSFAALYLAVTALRARHCQLAIVGGVHLNLCPENFIGLTKANMLSATGQCSSFDASADGFVRSEGCGVLIVKRLSDAIKDNNTIHAVLKSIVMNQDGEGAGLTAPNPEAQISLYQEVLKQADLAASDIDYIETHGTGTPVGDSVEFNALEYVHQHQHSPEKPLVIGALKSNLGHTISTSGLASLIKVIAAFHYDTIPPNLHYTIPNPAIHPDNVPAFFPVTAIPFVKQSHKKRTVQISNFGFSGINVGAVVEEPPGNLLKIPSQEENQPQCFVLSAKSQYSLEHMLAGYIPYLQQSSASLRDICLTLIHCRDHFKYRCAIIANSKDELIKKISAGTYEVKKVTLKNNLPITTFSAQAVFEAYLAGSNLKEGCPHTDYNQVDLPLYYFERKPYWHLPRNTVDTKDWLNSLYQQSKEQQVATLTSALMPHIQRLLKRDSIDPYHDFELLGFTQPLLDDLNQLLQDMFADRCHLSASLASFHFTLDKLARHIQQIFFPEQVVKQPAIQMLDVEPVAIIGMSCRFPKAANVEEFLSLLEHGESGMADIPLERWDNDKFYDADVDALGKLYIKQLGLIDNVRHFDADFFNISPREAKLMSPQLRVCMETSYHALEDANLSLDHIKDSNTGVFVGCGTNEYPRVLGNLGVSLEDLNIYFATGNVLNALAGRVAYAFDFHGPIQAIDTACSSSMTAIHNACLSLQSGDCDMALAGGVNILLIPDSNITLSKARMLSPDSRCKTFSEDADGYARSEGCGMVVLKRLSSALADKDNILAVIKGTSINSDGKSGGFTVPNAVAQEEVIRSALAKARLSPGDVDYIEAHGTGTPVADPIEANTLIKVFDEFHSKEKPFYISSVKTNIGHCESASGVAGVIKAVLSLKNKKIFKHLNFKKLNPWIDLKNAVIPLDTIDWPNQKQLRCAGVSSFGFSGANAHIVLQQVPDRKKERHSFPGDSLLVISAKSKRALELLLSSYERFLSSTEESFANICYTAATCRSHFLFRVAIKAATAKEAARIIANHEYTIFPLKKEKDSLHQPQTLEQLCIAYQEGILINWIEFYKHLDYSFEKVKLPLYEFARVEHWFVGKDKLKDAPLPKDWGFQLHWQKQACVKATSTVQGNHWLLVGAAHLATDFVAQGLNIVSEDSDYQPEQLAGIIFALGLDSTLPADIDANIDTQKNIIKKLLNLLKKLNQKAVRLKLIVLTTNAIAELATDPLNLSNSPLIGFCKTLVLELPQYHTILIDFDTFNVAQIVDEIKYNNDPYYEHQIAYREGKRWVGRLKKFTLMDKKRVIDDKGRYLVTGGCGGLGLVTAQALLSAGAREIVLTSRTIDKPAIKAAIKKIQADYTGRRVRVISLDVSDKEQVRQLLADLNADGLLKGIIHAAGAAIKTALIAHEEQDVDYLFSAKVKGGWYLHELSQSCDLDFFVVYSSVSAVFGSNKESVYSGANSFLDALMAERQRLGLPGTAIQWGPWGDVGMANKRSRDPNLKQALINNQQGHALIKVLINGQHHHATIISPDYLKFMLDFVPKPAAAFYNALTEELNSSEQTVNKNVSSWLNDYLKLSADNRFQACKDLLSEICKGILEVAHTDTLDEDEGFFELGFDSLMITEMAAELKAKVEPALKVTVSVGFEYPSINQLAEYLEAELDTHLIKEQKSTSLSRSSEDAIAVIGMSCSLPNASDIAAFETLLEHGLSGMRDIPLERWDNRKYYDPNMDAPGKSYVNTLGLIEHIKEFDAGFFGISPREAKLMEPQQRIFLECCYKALEHANYPPDSLRGSLTGVFAGVGPNEYYALLEKSGFSNEELSAYSITGNVLNLIPGRVAYTFDFKGPSLSIDTACSSSLVAIHYACQSLKNHETNYALAGGINILLMPESNITLCKAKALSPEGKCKTFDEHADGYARAEGCGVIFLKRLSDAVRDQDTIFAVIKASAVNNDGKSAGLTVPNGKSQEEVMATALRQTDLTAEDISYIEAHGTGTPLGDPVEVHAINAVYGVRHPDNPLFLGTVKTNIGHLESASGIAGVIKTIIALQKRKIYKILNFHQLNPNIQLNNTHIALQTMDWNGKAKLHCAGVNAFGFSGTNAHVILQEYPQIIPEGLTKSAKKHLLVLSAKSTVALERLVARYQHYLKTTAYHFGDICYTAATCREHYSHRLALVAEDAAQASQLLEAGQFALSDERLNILDLSFDNRAEFVLKEYLQGKPASWQEFYKNSKEDFVKVILPHYTFHRSEFWPDKKHSMTIPRQGIHPLLGQMMSLPGNEYLFTNQLDLEHLSYINQHRVFDKVIFPATAYLEGGLAIAKCIWQRNSFCMEQFHIERPLYPKPGQEIQFQVKPKHESYKLSIFAKQNDTWHVFAAMELNPLVSSSPESIDIEDLKLSFGKKVDVSQIYQHFNEQALFYGDEFQVLQEAYVKLGSVFAKVVLKQGTHGQEYHHHPVLLDGAMQSILLLGNNSSGKNMTFVPYALRRMTTLQAAPQSIWVHLIQHATEHENELCVDIKLYDNSGFMISHIEELKLKAVTRNNFISYESSLQHLYYRRWQTLPLDMPRPVHLPDFWVVGQDEPKARQLLGDIDYHFVDDLSTLECLEEKHIIFLYEQSQFNKLFHSCQRMFKLCPGSFIFVTENAYAIHPEDEVNPYHTMASAFWKSFANELEFHKNYAVDLGSHNNLQGVLQYLFAATTPENQFAVRDTIYVPRLKRKPVSMHQELPGQLFDPEACYLVIGGTGGLAKPLIEYLIRRGVSEIVITSRSECSTDTQLVIEAARQKQVLIRHYQADASNYQDMEEVIENIQRCCKRLKGVFHLAGIVHDGLIVNLTDADMQKVLNAKMDSALILHQLTKDMPLDMFVLFSSSASLLGARGQANYVAANGFLDGLAHLRRQQGLAALAINWGPFHTVGMSAQLTHLLKQHGFIPLDPENIEILDVLLSTKPIQIAPCPIHWDTYLKYAPKQTELSHLARITPPADQHFLNALRERNGAGRIKLLNQVLLDITVEVLALDDNNQITLKDNLFFLGMDSLMAIEIRNRIHDKLQCPSLSLSIEYFINDPSIENMVRIIARELEPFLDPVSDTLSSAQQPAGETALCDFQYIFWVLNKLDYSFNIGMQIQLHGKLNKEYLFQAFDCVIQQHGAFWLNFNKQVPTQMVKSQGKFNLIYKDISLSNTTKGLNEEFYNNTMRLIPLNKQPLIRVYLYKINNDLHELHLLIPHIIVDDTSCNIVFRQFKNNYESLVLGKKLKPLPPNHSYLHYVKNINRHYEHHLKEKIAFWECYNKGVKMLYLGKANHLPDAANQEQHLFHYPIKPRPVEQFIQWHKDKNINVSTGLIAACQIVFYQMCRQKNIPIILIHSGREGSQYQSTVGLFSEYKKINIALEPQDKFIDFIRSIEDQLLKTAPYQKCSHFIKDSGLTGARLSVGQYLSFIMTSLLSAKNFQGSKLNQILIKYYLKYLGRVLSIRTVLSLKNKMNTLFKWKLALQKPARLRVIISITPSFFTRESVDQKFANLGYSFPSHFGCMDRPISNRTLWIYFSRDQEGNYQLSINGPLTKEAKERISIHFNELIAKLAENEDDRIVHLIEK